jgi:hypothetical protein
MSFEEFELPCILDDFPNYHLKSQGEIPEKKTKELSDEVIFKNNF